MNSSLLSDKPYIEKLSVQHSVKNFDCGVPSLNKFLTNYALQNQSSGSSTTYVAILGGEVIGYYSITVASVMSCSRNACAKALLRTKILRFFI